MNTKIHERYLRLKNRKAKDWWTTTFGDPLSWLILSLIGDWKFITPDRITILSFFCKIGPAAMILFKGRPVVIAAAIILQVGQILDSMDGNLARYRGITSLQGSFIDKILDGTGFLFLCSSLSWHIYQNGGAAYYLIMGPLTAGLYLSICYMYWVTAFAELQKSGDVKKTRVEKNVKSISDIPLWKYIIKGQKKILKFNQADFYFWIGLGLIINHPEIVLWILFVMLLKKTIRRFFVRRKQLIKLEREY